MNFHAHTEKPSLASLEILYLVSDFSVGVEKVCVL